MRRILVLLMASLLVIGLVLPGCGSSPSTLTTLSAAEGDVSVMKTGTDSWMEVEVGMYLEVGDSVRTGDDSSAEITFFDGSTIELEAGTEIEIISLGISGDNGSITIILEQTIGSIIFRVTKIIDPASRYEVETPAGVVAVRGSAVQVYVTEDGTTRAINLGGDIWAVGEGVELQIPEGQECIIRPGERPELIYLDMIGPGLWSLYVLGEGIEATVTEEGVTVDITADPTNDPDEQTFKVGAWTMYSVEGDFDIRVDYELTTWPQGSGVRVGLNVGVPGIPGGEIRVERVGFGPGSDFPDYPREVYLVGADQGVQVVTSTDDSSGTLRILREGEMVSCYYATLGGWYGLYEAEWSAQDAWVDIGIWSHEGVFGGEEVSVLMRTVELLNL